MPLAAGSFLGPYEVLSPLGAGGMGEVYRARDSRLNRVVALKLLPDSFASDPDRLRRFELEAQTVGALNHPNILIVHDTGVDAGLRAPVPPGDLPRIRAGSCIVTSSQRTCSLRMTGV